MYYLENNKIRIFVGVGEGEGVTILMLVVGHVQYFPEWKFHHFDLDKVILAKFETSYEDV